MSEIGQLISLVAELGAIKERIEQKNRRITELEEELNEKDALVDDLEQESGEYFEKLKQAEAERDKAYNFESVRKREAIKRAKDLEAENEQLKEVLERTENFLLGMHLDPAIPDHTRDAVFVKASDINEVLQGERGRS